MQKSLKSLLQLCCVFILLTLQVFAQSPLTKGQWVKISVEESGLYVIEESDLQAMGLKNLNNICVWGYGGRLLPEINKALKDHTLKQIPTLLQGGKLYFYGDGVVQWHYDSQLNCYRHTVNHYSRKGYYLISEGNATPLRMAEETAKSCDKKPTKQSLSYIQPFLIDYSEQTIAHTGRKLYSSLLYQSRKELIPEYNCHSLKMNLAYMGYPKQGKESIQVKVNGKDYFTTSISRTEVEQMPSAYAYGFFGMDKAYYSKNTISLNTAPRDISIEFITKPKVTSIHLDYCELNLEKLIDLREKQVFLRQNFTPQDELEQERQVTLPQPQDEMLLLQLDQTNPYQPILAKKLNFNPQNSLINIYLPNRNQYNLATNFLATSLKNAYKPKFISTIKPQDILSDQRAINLLIICSQSLREEALKLAEHYKSQGYTYAVWSQEEAFNEFNSGTPDAMCYRLLAKHYYDNFYKLEANKDKECPMSLLFLGDVAYDNRRISKEWQTANLQSADILLAYESVNSLDLTSYTSDDFFTILKDEDSEYNLNNLPNIVQQLMDICVGRLPAKTKEEASLMVDKIINYDKQAPQGSWKMKAAFVADNGNGNTHVNQSLEVSDILENLQPEVIVKRYYLPSYKRILVSGKPMTPQARLDFHNALNKGLFLVNYTGHGSANTWALEGILTSADVESLNYKQLPLIITASCDFSPFDTTSPSGGELLLLHPTSGAIALMSTTRVVWDIPNKNLNKAIIKELFSTQADGSYPSLGQALRRAKNLMRDLPTPENRLNFTLLGSPLQKLVLPPKKVVLSSINDQDLAQDSQIKVHALDKITLKGYIADKENSINGNFNGKIDILVYDGEIELETIDNFDDNPQAVVKPSKYKEFRNLIYTNTIPVEAGQFTCSFTVPKDVTYSGNLGRISFYAFDNANKKDAIGESRNLIITEGGSNSNQDKDAPKILQMKLAGKPVQSGMLVPSESAFYLLLEEKEGLNFSNAGLGHQMQLTINGKERLNIDLKPYFSPNTGHLDQGIISLILPKLTSGKYQAELRITDIYNNVLLKRFDFIVQENLLPDIEELKISFVNDGTLILKQEFLLKESIAVVEVFDVMGQRVYATQGTKIHNLSSSYSAFSLKRLGLEQIKALPTGTYILRLRLYPELESEHFSHKSIKFVIP